MKKIIVLSTLSFLILSPMIHAQESKSNGDKGKSHAEIKKEKKMDRMQEELDLTEDQRKKMDEIHAKFKPQEDANKEQIKKLHEEGRKLNKAKKAEMKAVLTPEQLEKMESKKRQRIKKLKKQQKVQRKPIPSKQMKNKSEEKIKK